MRWKISQGAANSSTSKYAALSKYGIAESFPERAVGRLKRSGRHTSLAHAAILEFFATAAGAGIVPADALSLIAYRLDLLGVALRAVDGRLLLLADGRRGRRFLVDRGGFLPRRSHKAFVQLF